VAGFDGRTLTVGLTNAGARDRFVSSGSDEILRQALIDVLGADWRIEAIVDPTVGQGGGPPAGGPPGGSTVARPAPAEPSARQPAPPGGPPAEHEQAPPPPKASPETVGQARGAIRPTRDGRSGGGAAAAGAGAGAADDDAHPDDPDADDAGLSHAELLERELGARVIEEIPHE
jgi:DNA polymerase-3 subunit gamma/tau